MHCARGRREMGMDNVNLHQAHNLATVLKLPTHSYTRSLFYSQTATRCAQYHQLNEWRKGQVTLGTLKKHRADLLPFRIIKFVLSLYYFIWPAVLGERRTWKVLGSSPATSKRTRHFPSPSPRFLR